MCTDFPCDPYDHFVKSVGDVSVIKWECTWLGLVFFFQCMIHPMLRKTLSRSIHRIAILGDNISKTIFYRTVLQLS